MKKKTIVTEIKAIEYNPLSIGYSTLKLREIVQITIIIYYYNYSLLRFLMYYCTGEEVSHFGVLTKDANYANLMTEKIPTYTYVGTSACLPPKRATFQPIKKILNVLAALKQETMLTL